MLSPTISTPCKVHNKGLLNGTW